MLTLSSHLMVCTSSSPFAKEGLSFSLTGFLSFEKSRLSLFSLLSSFIGDFELSRFFSRLRPFCFLPASSTVR